MCCGDSSKYYILKHIGILTVCVPCSEGIQSRMGSDMLTKIWKLKRIVTQVIEDIKGCERAVDEVQDDDEAVCRLP